jgi:hypothetical protein
MPRRKGDLGKKTLMDIAAGLIEDPRIAKAEFEAATRQRTQAEIVGEVSELFEVYEAIVHSALAGHQRGVIVAGTAGIGKTYTVNSLCERAKEKNDQRFELVKGKITPLQLYSLCYKFSAKGEIVILDDADTIFNDESGLNLLKALMDTTNERKVSWLTSRMTEETEIPESYIYNGCLFFLSNRNLRAESKGDTAVAEHKKAIISRAQYLDLRIHSKQDAALWSAHVVEKERILEIRGLTKKQQTEVMAWVAEHANAIDEDTSIRTAIKISELVKASPENWKRLAGHTLLSLGGREELRKQQITTKAREEAKAAIEAERKKQG